MIRSCASWCVAVGALAVAGCQTPPGPGGRMGAEGRRPWGEIPPSQIRNAQHPKVLPETHFAAARMFESRRALDQAIRQYRKAIAVNHSYVEAYHRLGLCLSVTGRHDEAVEAMRRAVELRPKDASLRNDLGFELLMARRVAEGHEQLQKAVELKPDFVRAHVNLGIARAKLGRFEAALATFKTVLPEPDAYYNLALLYRAEKRYDEAAETLRHVLTLDPNFTAAQTQLEQLVESGRLKEVQPAASPAAEPASRGGAAGKRISGAAVEPDGLRDGLSSALRNETGAAVATPRVVRAELKGEGIDAAGRASQRAAHGPVCEADGPFICPGEPPLLACETAYESELSGVARSAHPRRLSAEIDLPGPEFSNEDPIAALRELENDLAVVRNEIQCLEGMEFTAEFTSRHPLPSIRVRVPMLISAGAHLLPATTTPEDERGESPTPHPLQRPTP